MNNYATSYYRESALCCFIGCKDKHLDQVVDAHERKVTGSMTSAGKKSPLKPILLVEDNDDDVDLMLHAFKRTNLANEIVVVRDGQAALDFLHRKGEFGKREDAQPGLVLLDLKLPKVDGLTVLKEIKADKKLRVIPVVVFTSSREEKDQLESYDLGVNAFVVKPMDFKDFIVAIGELGLFWAVFNEPPPSKSGLA